MTYPTNPSFDTRILGLAAKALWRITSALLSKTEELNERFDMSAKADLDDEADDLRAVIADCNKAKAQAEDRLTEVLDYLDPDDFYGGLTPRPQVPESVGPPPVTDTRDPVDEDDAPAGYRAVKFDSCPDSLAYATCEHCAFGDHAGTDKAGPCSTAYRIDSLRCSAADRIDGREVIFIKRG